MVKITKEELLKLGKISQIDISEQEIPALLTKLQAVLSYAEHLKEIAAQHNNQQTLARNANIMRSDQVKPCDAELILSRAPVREENYFVVPMILKGTPDL